MFSNSGNDDNASFTIVVLRFEDSIFIRHTLPVCILTRGKNSYDKIKSITNGLGFLLLVHPVEYVIQRTMLTE